MSNSYYLKRTQRKKLIEPRTSGATAITASDLQRAINDSASSISDILDGYTSSLTADINLLAGQQHIYQDAYTIEAKTIGSPLLNSSHDRYIIQCAVHHTLTGEDYTDRIFDRPTPLIIPQWYRINPEGHDRKGRTDTEWQDAHRGAREVIITRDDFVTSCTVGYKIDRKTLIDTINNLKK